MIAAIIGLLIGAVIGGAIYGLLIMLLSKPVAGRRVPFGEAFKAAFAIAIVGGGVNLLLGQLGMQPIVAGLLGAVIQFAIATVLMSKMLDIPMTKAAIIALIIAAIGLAITVLFVVLGAAALVAAGAAGTGGAPVGTP